MKGFFLKGLAPVMLGLACAVAGAADEALTLTLPDGRSLPAIVRVPDGAAGRFPRSCCSEAFAKRRACSTGCAPRAR